MKRAAAIRLFALAVLVTTLAVAAVPHPAAASSFCEVVRTSDGFAALRARPARTAPVVGRMRAGDEVLLLGDQDLSGTVWWRVRWWRGTDRLDKGFDRHAGEGFVHRSLVDDCG
jgi:lauroyl/myristoyl acyltransferase